MLKIKGKAGLSKKEKGGKAPKDYLQMAAYYHWQARGCPCGDPITDWLAAERDWHFRHEHPKRKWWQTKQDTIPFMARIFEQS